MRRISILTIMIVIFAMLLSGCGGKEPNEIAYVVALGLDSAPDNNYKITIQYANTTQISGGGGEEGGKSGTEIVEHVTVEAPNLYAGMGIANQIVSKTFSLSHTKLIVFSSEIAQKGLKDITETFARSEEIRPDITLAIARGEANKYLTSVKPEMEVNPAQYYQLVYQKNNFLGVPQGLAKDFFFAIKTGDYDSVLPIAGVIKTPEEGQQGESQQSESQQQGGQQQGGQQGGGQQQSGQQGEGQQQGGQQGEGQQQGGQQGGGQQQSGQQGEDRQQSGNGQENEEQKNAPINENPFEFKMKDYLGGQAAVEKKNKSESIGSAVFKKDKLVGFIGSIETEMFKILSCDYNDSYITFYSKKTPDIPITIKAIQSKKPKYDIDIENKKINVEIFMESDFYSLPADYNAENSIKEFENDAVDYMNESFRAFMKESMKAFDADIFKLKERCKKKFLTNEEYEQFKKDVDFNEYDINVTTNFRIRRMGLIIKEDNE